METNFGRSNKISTYSYINIIRKLHNHAYFMYTVKNSILILQNIITVFILVNYKKFYNYFNT